MYPYHNEIKRRIKNGELLSFDFRDYKKISPCLVLEFKTEPKFRPIREHRFDEYMSLLEEL